ncbi:MAG: hypothetical protein ACK40O_09795 [Allosphingosinicella sp.]
MRNLLLFTGAAALALSMPAAADPGGKGGGNGNGKGQAAKVDRGPGGGKGNRAQQAQRGGGKPAKAQRQAARAGNPAKAQRQAARAVKPDRPQRQAVRAGKPDKAERRVVRDVRERQDRLVRSDRRERFDRDERRWRDRDRDRREMVDLRALRGEERRFADLGAGCPPGLAKKGNGCLPPGQAKKLFARGDRIQPAWFSGYDVPVRYRSFYRDTPDHYYRYDQDGYIYRVRSGDNLIASVIPLFGGGFNVGQPLPQGYDIYNVPYGYRDAYYDTDDYLYRYGDNAIYRVDRQSGVIESIVSLLAGDLAVGQPLPAGYDVYNVPLDYRDRYYDTDEAMYRYGDGAIYQVDPQTQIIQAIVEMLI